jgi:hypothetical protein
MGALRGPHNDTTMAEQASVAVPSDQTPGVASGCTSLVR